MDTSTPINDSDSAVRLLQEGDSSPDEKLKAGRFLISGNHYDFYPLVLEKLAPLQTVFAANVEWNYCMGYAYVTQQRPDEALPHLSKLVSGIPANALAYMPLSWAYLQLGQWTQAFLVSSAGLKNCSQTAGLPGLQVLSHQLMQGQDSVGFLLESVDYKFHLFASNTQEIEASLHHLANKLTEWEELQMLKRHLQGISSIAEIGCLVGNHSVFFLKNFPLKRMTIVDGSETSLEHTRKNLELNRGEETAIDLEFIHAAIGVGEGEVSFFGKSVPVNSIGALLKDPHDFLKIDVDGVEMEALEGSKDYLIQHKPKVMIEVLHTLKFEFAGFISAVGYRIIDQIDRQDYSNYLIGPN
jgi:FkbM family methyltransferase